VTPARRPFPRLPLGEPARVTGDGREPSLRRAAAALAPLVARARAAEAALVLVGHGNARLSQRVFSRLEAVLRREYGAGIHIGTVESPPLAADVVEALRQAARPPRRVLLAPLMLVAGDHARHDIAGDSDDSWAAVLTRAGFAVTVHREGLGSLPSWADLYVEHLGRLLPA
ncbi:MAG: sirohydrochlorin cobaltochelatase, partial [Planctomycetes bacterium]|nr:sirohydrochlorin cobaltochelatase [Planctomycetota bacterium]